MSAYISSQIVADARGGVRYPRCKSRCRHTDKRCGLVKIAQQGEHRLLVIRSGAVAALQAVSARALAVW